MAYQDLCNSSGNTQKAFKHDTSAEHASVPGAWRMDYVFTWDDPGLYSRNPHYHGILKLVGGDDLPLGSAPSILFFMWT